ncbi:ribokinase [Corynebacterium pseudotuberculosis]|nr:ribokinase [Corynebacterium pseudotuberculosis]
MLKTVAVVGSINADLSVRVHRPPTPGETVLGMDSSISPGGKGANQAVAAALQGAKVVFIGAVGKDSYAEPAMELLRASSVSLEHVSAVDGPTGSAVITVSDDGENSIIVIPGANAAVDAAYVAKNAEAIAGADIVLLQGEIPADGFLEAIKAATGRIVVNLAPVISVDREALLKADPLMANEHEANLILEQLGSSISSDDPHELAQELLAQGFASVVLTLGSKGALVADPQASVIVPSPKVTAVDTTGAGDAFAGAFVAQLLSGASSVEAAQHAVRVAAYAVQYRGTQVSYPTRAPNSRVSPDKM